MVAMLEYLGSRAICLVPPQDMVTTAGGLVVGSPVLCSKHSVPVGSAGQDQAAPRLLLRCLALQPSPAPYCTLYDMLHEIGNTDSCRKRVQCRTPFLQESVFSILSGMHGEPPLSQTFAGLYKVQ
eukprot:1192188-Prorocentrum_minimum.AAC.14